MTGAGLIHRHSCRIGECLDSNLLSIHSLECWDPAWCTDCSTESSSKVHHSCSIQWPQLESTHSDQSPLDSSCKELRGEVSVSDIRSQILQVLRCYTVAHDSSWVAGRVVTDLLIGTLADGGLVACAPDLGDKRWSGGWSKIHADVYIHMLICKNPTELAKRFGSD